jgi:pyrroline-5-carboxylate reductase
MKIAGFRLTRAGSSSNLPVSGSMIHTDGYPRRKIRMLNEKTIAFIGVGNMGEALISGLLANGSARPEQIICTDANPAKRDAIGAKYGVQTMAENVGAVRAADIVVYAVKPQILAKVLRETADELDMRKLVISIAAGVPLAAIESCLEKKLRLIRVMPNICAFVGESATAVAGGDNASPEDIQVAMAIFDAVGKTVFIGENYLMDAITGLSGSGPAYIFMIVDAMADAGVKMGLARQDALFLSAQTLLGAAKLLLESKEHPGQLKDRVTSPGGTAIAGIHTLEKGGLRTTLINAVEAATARARELGEICIQHFANGGSR